MKYKTKRILIIYSIVFVLGYVIMTITLNLGQTPLSPLRSNSSSSSELEVLLHLNKTLTSLRSKLLSSITREGHRENSMTKLNVIDAINTSSPAVGRTAATVNSVLVIEPLQSQSQPQFIRRKSSSGLLAGKRAVIFTMDSIESYEQNSLVGGAAGELAVRKSLQRAFTHLSMSFFVAKSDEDFNRCNLENFDFVILDPWTWAQKGWVPKSILNGHERKVFILDFFGSEKFRGSGIAGVGPKRFLTAFGSPWNTFLGYFIEPSDLNTGKAAPTKLQQGVIWGKDAKHFEGREKQLLAVARSVRLLSTASSPVFRHDNVQWLGHRSSEEWMQLLAQSKFLIGLGNPLLGPSAIDAVSVGCMFLNPLFDPAQPVRSHPWAGSQHPYAAANLGEPYVCSFRQNDSSLKELLACVDKALSTSLPPFIPKDFTFEEYIERVKTIFTEL